MFGKRQIAGERSMWRTAKRLSGFKIDGEKEET